MPHITTDDGVRLYYEETGSGTPIAFVHEFADDFVLAQDFGDGWWLSLRGSGCCSGHETERLQTRDATLNLGRRA